MKNRNPAANCGNCPYWATFNDGSTGECRAETPKAYTFNSGEVEYYLSTHHYHWCGQHTDFWEQSEITNTCPSCWPASDDGAQSTTYCPHCGKATTSTFEQDKP